MEDCREGDCQQKRETAYRICIGYRGCLTPALTSFELQVFPVPGESQACVRSTDLELQLGGTAGEKC